MYISKTLLATIIGTSLILSGCNDGNDSTPTPTPTPTTVQTEATVSSTKANIAIFSKNCLCNITPCLSDFISEFVSKNCLCNIPYTVLKNHKQ